MKRVTRTKVVTPSGAGSATNGSKTNAPRSRVRAYVEANSIHRSQALFNEELPRGSIPLNTIEEARKTGILNLSSKNLNEVPSRVWSLNEVQKEEASTLSVSLDNASDQQKWWEFQELQKLLIANNCISVIPAQIGELTCLQVLDAHDNQIVSLPDELGNLDKLSKLDLSRNKITELPSDLYKLRRLVELRLGHNALTSLSPDIGSFAKLHVLDLSNNQLTAIPPDIGFQGSLTTLNLSKNKIESLPPDFSGLTGLHSLDLSENLLTDIGPLLSEFSRLEILYLQQNKLKEIPMLQNTRHLTELYMRHNQVRKFSSSFFLGIPIKLIDLRSNKISEFEITAVSHLEVLDRFYLDCNNIEILPDALALLPALKQLTLEGNPLRGIRLDILQRGSVELLRYLRAKLRESPEKFTNEENRGIFVVSNIGGNDNNVEVDIHKLKASRNLQLVSMKLAAIPSPVFEAAAEARVTNMDFSHNLLTAFMPSIETACLHLRELVLDHNKLLELPALIGLTCPHLYYISCQNNQMKSLPSEFENLVHLREINISYNKFTSIPSCLYELSSLEILLAQDNKIETIDPEGLKRIEKLAVLNLDNNNISHCPPELGYLPLTKLAIQGNAFRIPAYHVLAKGTESTLAYLRNRIVPPK